jgi:magnesium-transporting ATPase (P-type)
VVLRSGRSRELFLLNEDQLCAGDIIEVGTGDQVPCDCLIIESNGLEIDGKTVPVTNQFGRIYTDAIITGGFGKCVVCCVGNATFKYKSHKRKLAQQEGTALQADMTSIGKRL